MSEVYTPTLGDHVTATVTDEYGVTRDFHMRVDRVETRYQWLVENSNGSLRSLTSLTGLPAPEGTTCLSGEWLYLTPLTKATLRGDGYDLRGHGPNTTHGDMAYHGPGWQAFHKTLVVLPSVENVTVTPQPADAVEWVREHESVDARRTRLLKELAHLDPNLAEQVEELLDDVAMDAADSALEHSQY